jgi:FkbM family methyltransferase
MVLFLQTDAKLGTKVFKKQIIVKKIFRLYQFVGILGLSKIVLYSLLHKVDKKLSNYAIEIYHLSIFLNRIKGTLTNDNPALKVEFNVLDRRLVFNLRSGASDAHVLVQIFEKKEYQPLVTLVKSFPLIEINTIVDAGANAGFTSVFFGLHFPAARIISVEPDPDNFALLEKNLSLNAVSGLALKKAVWGLPERVKISNDFRDHREWSRRIEKIMSVELVENTLDGITLAGIIASEKWTEIDILKMDIEGAEEYVFDDPIASVSLLSKVRFIAIELHDEVSFRAKFEGYLQQAGFVFTNIGESLIGVNLKIVKY